VPITSRRVALFAIYQRDPVCWASDMFPVGQRPRDWQIEALANYAAHDYSAAVTCRDGGKTRYAAYSALHFFCTRPESLVTTVAPVWRQVERAIWVEIRKLWQVSKLPKLFPKFEVLLSEIKTPHAQWRMYGMASDRAENIEGGHGGDGGTFVVLDEAKGIRNHFRDSVAGMLGDATKVNKLIAIGTPGPPLGWFADAFTSQRNLWGAQIRVASSQIPRLAAHCEAERLRLGDSNPWFRQQQLAEFAGADEYTVIPLDAIRAATERRFVDTDAPKIASLDPAGLGSDECALTFRQGRQQIAINAWQGWDEMKSAARAWQLAHDWGAEEIWVDAPGMGGPMASKIEELETANGSRMKVYRYQPGNPPRDTERFVSRKAEDVFALADVFRSGEIGIQDDPLLIGQLSAWRWDDSGDRRKTRVLDPDDSPDRADSVNIAWQNSKITIRNESPRGL